MPDTSTSRPFYRRKGWWILAILLSPLLVGLVMVLAAHQSLNAKLAKLREAGFPTNGAELNDFYVVPPNHKDATDLWMAAVDAVAVSDVSERGQELPYVGVSEVPVPNPGEEWSQRDAARKFLADYDDLRATIATATKAGGVARYPVDFRQGVYFDTAYAEGLRTITRILQLQSDLSAHDGRHDQALNDLLAIFAARDSLRMEPCLISQLFVCAIHAMGCEVTERLLPHCDWDDAQLATLQFAISDINFMDSLRTALVGERALSLMTLDQMGIAPLAFSNRKVLLQCFEQSLNTMPGKWPQVQKQLTTIETETQQAGKGRMKSLLRFAGMLLLPSIRHAATAMARCEARRRCLVLAIAVQRHRLRHLTFPATLAELDASLLPPNASLSLLMQDPFKDQVLQFKAADGEIVVYSVGVNQNDDGGVLDSERGELPDVGSRLMWIANTLP